MSLAVVDASVLAAFYMAGDPRREAVVARLAAGDSLLAPAHLARFPIRRMPLVPLDRIWELRANVTPYDAAYVVLAEQLGAPDHV